MKRMKSLNMYKKKQKKNCCEFKMSLSEYVKILTDNYQLRLSDLNKYPKINKSYNVINSIEYNPDLINSIISQYRPTQLFPNTIGSFLFGCLQNNYGDIPPECSPLCFNSIKNHNELSAKKCENQIFVQYTEELLENRFIKLGDCESKHGYVFVHINFTGFTDKEMEYFKMNDIYKLEILVTNNSKHHIVVKMTNLERLPRIIENYSELSDGTINQLNKQDDSQLYIIISIIIVIAMVMYSNKNA